MLIQLFLVPLKSYQIGLFKWAIDKHLHLRCLVTITNDCLYILYLSVNLFVCVCACTLLEKKETSLYSTTLSIKWERCSLQ